LISYNIIQQMRLDRSVVCARGRLMTSSVNAAEARYTLPVFTGRVC